MPALPIVELNSDFFVEYPAAVDEPDTIDTNEVITAVAKTMAGLTCRQDGPFRKDMSEQPMREIMKYDTEFRKQEAMACDIGPCPR